MDAFKLLTRATKLKTGATPSSAQSSTRLPSTGKAENPQLFRNSEAEKVLEQAQQGKKRKRTAAAEARDADDDAAELNFFGARKAAVSSTPTSKEEKQEQERSGEDDASDEEVEFMDEVQRRTVLNAHKIKVTDLRDLEEIQPVRVASEEPKKKKKKRKQQEEEESKVPLTKKEQKKARRLYPEPLVSFKELRSKYKISSRLAENIAEQGFTVPTEVQLGTLPLLLGGFESKAGESVEPDLLVVAPTGSGKTLSFLIPVINKIVRHHHDQSQEQERGIFSIIVAPTKELASQIVNEGRKLVHGTGVKIALMKKGMRVVEREDEDDDGDDSSSEDGDESSESEHEERPIAKKSKGKAPVTKSDILVTTPLQLVNALSTNQTKPMATLPLVRNIVLDEADVLLDPLFRDQTLNIWRACTHPELRASLWSATMGSNVEDLAKSTIKERKEAVNQTKSYPLLRLVVGLKDSAIPNIEHKLIYAATEQGKLLGLRQLLHPTAASASDVRLRPPFLIFTQTIPRAVALHSELRYDIPTEAGGSSRIAVLHSDLSDGQRSEIMKNFRKGEIWILVTTDLLARGVDFRGINGVVNYDIPNSAAVYVHRVGRTGRAGREGGIAVTYYTKEDIPYVKSIANIIDVSEKLRGKTGEKSIQKWLLDALPDLSKKDKKELKKHGVKARQSNLKSDKDDKEHRKTRISTKSGFERRIENKKKALIAANRNRKSQAQSAADGDSGNESWDGLEN
ncbi:RNA-dependent ATPase ROK1 [Aspergillus clavatus NRRL 1]|uniref:ATP-dependent RNA helicase rok1 n=1 Tax=Aspergillus clavatus (strain ATCC 1007 / CBS 513.65 / DSM 816 / NCTC 3887 / NRRL 1 / QM 1276 / 107) TaxID=344612 RepID=ROK1_ASPCL|nr:ATP dependent RNA helicase (Rok1), putative [Aspergillus clavatus NRRL 1]A1CNK1.1 RecName: Full=ATP-dependent RNA helicase rok1 [Aspergillus clavatus NRRL 1]EAW07222.1 ATP dependent RNA helicase (Rok1), putative [Aspergillus clavatus NRRL 1]